MILEKLDRWSYWILLMFIFAASLIPAYSGIFFTIAILLVLAKLAFAKQGDKARVAFIGLGCYLLIFFILLPFSTNIYKSLRQYILITKSVAPLFISILLVRAGSFLWLTVSASIFLIIVAVFLGIPEEVYIQIPLIKGFLTRVHTIKSNSELIFLLGGNLLNLFPLLLVTSVNQQDVPGKLRWILMAGVASVLYVLWVVGSFVHYIPVIVMLLVWLTLYMTSERNSHWNKLFFPISVLVMSVVVLVSQYDLSHLWRIISALYREPAFWSLFQQQVLFGHGLDSVSNYYYQFDRTGFAGPAMQTMFSGIINLGIETGLLGLFAFLGMFVVLLRDHYFRWLQTGGQGALIGVLLLCGFMTNMLFFHYSIIPAVMMLFYFILGLTYVIDSDPA